MKLRMLGYTYKYETCLNAGMMGRIFIYIYIPVPNEKSGKCVDPGIQGISPGNSVCVRGEQPKPSPVRPMSPKE